MGDFLLVTHDADDATTPSAFTGLRQAATRHGMAVQALAPSAWIGLSGPRPPKRLTVGGWLLIGDVFDRRPHRGTDLPFIDDDYAYERGMMKRLWGRYAGVLLDRRGQAEAVMRDPSGAVECLTWSQDGLTIIASTLPDWLIKATRPPWRINIDRVADALADPLGSWARPLLDGLTALLPGTLQALPPDQPATPIWTPDVFVRHGERHPVSDEEAESRLRDAVDEAVAGFARIGVPLGAEVSGGLDSSIVASSLVRCSDAQVRLWLNAWGPDAEADERPYAEAVAATLGVRLATVERSPDLITSDMLTSLTQGLRPGFNALDTPNDRLLADLWSAAGVEAVMTGKGGDAVFIQSATNDVFTEIWRQQGWRSLLSPSLPELARWNGRSVWSLIKDARRPRSASEHLGQTLSFLTPRPPPPRHPWLDACGDLGPAKRYQIAGILNGVTFSAPSAQTAVADLLHPLLAQPVVEACLALPARQLTLGRRDRALARLAFRDRLPAMIADRRSKGEMTAYYGRRIAFSLDVLRPWLLEGRLAAEGLIDRTAAERLLSEESLIWRGRFGEIMIAAALEAWVREWEGRLSTAP